MQTKLSVDLIGTLRKIPAGTAFWSISLQEQISVTKDLVFEIRHICHTGDSVFGQLQLLFGLFPGVVPGRMDKHNGEIEISLSKTQVYQLPAYQPVTYSFSPPCPPDSSESIGTPPTST
jgi:hypothetical protein